MTEKFILLILMALLGGNLVSARPFSGEEVVDQDLRDVVIIDSLDLPILTEEFYHNVTFLNQQFDYETKNRINRLKMWSREVMTAGFVTMLGVVAVNCVIANKNDWSLWIGIPCATVVSVASMYPFILWSKHLKEKAESISSQTVYLYNINRHLELGATRFTNNHNCSLQAIGIGLKLNF